MSHTLMPHTALHQDGSAAVHWHHTCTLVHHVKALHPGIMPLPRPLLLADMSIQGCCIAQSQSSPDGWMCCSIQWQKAHLWTALPACMTVPDRTALLFTEFLQ